MEKKLNSKVEAQLEAQIDAEQKQGSFLTKVLVVGAVVGTGIAFADDSSTTGDNAFGKLFGIFTTWLQGNLGKILALLGFFGTVVVYMMTHKASVLVIGIIISVLVGGATGIAGIFFNAGLNSFNGN